MGSTIALAEAAGIEAGFLPAGWEIKVVAGGEELDGPAPAAQLISADAKTGEVVAIVGVTGIVDHVNDLIEPGAYLDTLKKRRPKVCWAHSWEIPVGAVRQIEEWSPGDPRFTQVKAQLDGRPWPVEAGALVARMRFNLKSDKGREAFAAVEFYSETGECEWSIGWQPVPTSTSRRKDGVRVCKKVELFEVSPVLFGAAPFTRTLEVKSLNLASATRRNVQSRVGQPAGDPTDPTAPLAIDPMAPDEEPTPSPTVADPTDEHALHQAAMDEIDWPEVDAAANPTAAAPGPGTPQVAAGAGGPVDPDGDGDDDSVPGGPGDTDAEEDGEPVDNAAEDGAEGDPVDAEDPEDAVDAGVDEAEEGDAPTGDPNGDPTDPEDAADGGADEAEEGDAPGKDPKKKKKKTASSTPPWVKKKGDAVLLDVKGLEAFTDALDIAALTGLVLPEVKAQGGLDQNRGNAEQLRHWYTKGGGAAQISWGSPGDFDRCTAIAGQHMDPERAKGWCNLRHKDAMGVYPATHAAMDRAGGMAGKSYAAAELLAKTWNPLLEVGAYAAHGRTERKFISDSLDGLSGSFEQRQTILRREIEPVLKDQIGWSKPTPADSGDAMKADGCWVTIDGTWPDRVVATICDFGGSERNKQSFVVPYTFTGTEVTFGKPTAVQMQVSIIPADSTPEPDADDLFAGVADDDGDGDGAAVAAGLGDALTMPVITLLGTGANAMKSAFAHSPEVKAGRVLSEANASRLRGALEHLLEVARSAGIDLPGWTGPDADPADTGEMPDTTAPSAPPTAAPVRPAATTAMRHGTQVKVLTTDQLSAQLGEFDNFLS